MEEEPKEGTIEFYRKRRDDDWDRIISIEKEESKQQAEYLLSTGVFSVGAMVIQHNRIKTRVYEIITKPVVDDKPFIDGYDSSFYPLCKAIMLCEFDEMDLDSFDFKAVKMYKEPIEIDIDLTYMIPVKEEFMYKVKQIRSTTWKTR